jgi:UDP-3-O-[3-hydroxymyristoyl] N-acetylglucosamine deacetylase
MWGHGLRQQRTIAEKVSVQGVGLHCGLPIELTLRPGRIDSGVVFVRRDLPDEGEIPARPGAVRSTSHATTLARGAAVVSTVEHLLAALHAMRIDNVRVEVDGPEVPVMDGSAIGFVELLGRAGVFAQSAPRAQFSVVRPLEVDEGGKRIAIEPADGFYVSYALDFAHPAIGHQELELPRLGPGVFEREIARARTFGFLEEVNELWRAGLARGGSLENTVVLDERRVLNPDGLRWPDEFVRHKILDLLGDLSLLGLPIRGRVRVERGGHSLHHRLICALLENPQAWRVTDGRDDSAEGERRYRDGERRSPNGRRRPGSSARPLASADPTAAHSS